MRGGRPVLNDFSLRREPDPGELPTAAAELVIMVADARDGEAMSAQDEGWQVPRRPARWPARAEDGSSLQEQPSPGELPTVAAELVIRLAAVDKTGSP
jgi:hypothetical protein